ncbi:MAG: DNA-directed RNA polymerase subunit omega [Bacteroidetes bacterium]|nr:MAG: DNA-directed RNA polymerase subunit omega [Bacteroidota bacterium]
MINDHLSFLPLDTKAIGEMSGNLYKSLAIIGRRANEHTLELKDELSKKLAEFAPAYDNLEEVMENKEQIEISRYYERKPKSTQVALEDFIAGKVAFLDPHETAL